MFEQDAEGYLRMFTMMEPTGHQTRDFFSAVRQRIPQVLALPLPAQTRKSFAESQSAGKSPDLESPWNMLDQNTWLAKDGEPTLKAFFSAAARGDQQTTRSLLASPPPLSDPALATFLRDCQAHHASFAFASASITRAGAVTCCLRLSSASGDTPTKLMSVTLQGAHGHYKLASLPKWDEN